MDRKSEIVTTLDSLAPTLEDPDARSGLYAYTMDAQSTMTGSAPVHGHEQMLRNSHKSPVLYSATITPDTIEGSGDLAFADDLFTCRLGRTENSPGTPVALKSLMVLRKESGGVWRIAREVLRPDTPAELD